MRFGILGSCVSRDLFSLVAAPFEVTAGTYVARSTIRSLMAPASPEMTTWLRGVDLGSFEKRIAAVDVRKQGLALLAGDAFSCLIIDLIDERHRTLSNGAYTITYSEGLRKLASGGTMPGWKFEDPLVDETIAETLRALPRWASGIRNIAAGRQVILHRALWASRCRADGKTTDFDQHPVERWNDVLSTYYGEAQALLGCASVEADADNVVGDADHRWGPSPFHYVPAYYEDIWRKIGSLP